jgi:hypothetical protein
VRHSVDITTFLGFVAGGGLSAFAQPLGNLFPTHGSTIVNSIAIITLAASASLYLYHNPTDAPAKSIIADAPIIPKKEAS